jgi:hypothetical protein
MKIKNDEYLKEILSMNKAKDEREYLELANIQVYDNSIDNVTEIEKIVKRYNRHGHQLCYIATYNDDLSVEGFKDKCIFVIIHSSRTSALEMAMHICNRSEHKLKYSEVYNDSVLLVFKKEWECNDWI